MKFSIPFVSVLLLAAAGVEAGPLFRGKPAKNETLAAIYARRQATRADIAHRAHVKETMKRLSDHVRGQNARDDGSDDGASSAVNADSGLAPVLAGRGAAPRRRAPRSNAPAEEDTTDESGVQVSFEERANYQKCPSSGARTGYAHYPGWKLVGDDLSGGIPVHPESACIQACNKYGGSCSGVYFDAANKRCHLKGVHTAAWSFEKGSSTDGVDLVGGCALWSSVVPEGMDNVCCRA